MLLGDEEEVNEKGDKIFLVARQIYILATNCCVNRQLTTIMGDRVNRDLHLVVDPKNQSAGVFQAPLHIWNLEVRGRRVLPTRGFHY